VNFHFRAIVIGQVDHAILAIHFNYEEAGNGPYRPGLKGVHLSAIVSGKSCYGIEAIGLPNAAVEDITVDHCAFAGVADGVVLKQVRGVRFNGFTINGRIVPTPR